MEKKYHEFMKEITSDELFEGLLGHGMFNEKLPPFLTSESFFNYCIKGGKVPSGTPRDYVRFNGIRNNDVPRQYAIPTPFAYFDLCKLLSDNWDKICEHFETNTSNKEYKISRTHIRKRKKTKSIFKMNYENWKEDGMVETEILIGKRYMVSADISNCFPSIYTHSISWAIAGKEVAKANKNNKHLWYNKVDKFVRDMKNGETHGLLIGPHASNVLSEIILTSIDKNLSKWDYIRHIDDYNCFVPTYEDAQKFLLDLNRELAVFGLVLNHKKTEIVELPTGIKEPWVFRLKAPYLLIEKGQKTNKNEKKLRYPTIRSYIEMSINLMKENGMNSAILNYAIKVLSKCNFTKNAKNYFLKTVFHLSLIYPYLIPLIDEYIFCKLSVSKDDISKISNLIFERGMEERNYEAVSYSLYFALKYDFEIDALDADEMLKSEDCVAMLVSHHLFEKIGDNQSAKKLKDYAVKLSKKQYTMESNWLFVYEVLSTSELEEPWKSVKTCGTSFFRI